MDLKKLEQLAKFMKKENLKSLEIHDKDFKVSLVKQSDKPVQNVTAHAPRDKNPVPAQTTTKGTEIKSPLVGVFYSAPSPDAEPYVRVKKRVKKGDVLCLVEAMKQLNEIVAETDGEIAEICVKNGDVVEYGETLFRIV